MNDPAAPLISVITAVGRPEWDYLRAAGRSLAGLAGFSHAGASGVEWLVSYDPGPGVDGRAVAAAVAGLPALPVILAGTGGHRGPGPARTAALEAARGRWMYTLDSDDLINSAGLADLLAVASHDGSLGWVGGKTFHVGPDGRAGWSGPSDPWPAGRLPAGAYWDFFTRHGRTPCMVNATLIRTDLARAAGGWPDLPRNEDTALLAVVSASTPGAWVPSYCHTYRRHAASLTADERFPDLADNLDLIEGWIRAGSVRA